MGKLLGLQVEINKKPPILRGLVGFSQTFRGPIEILKAQQASCGVSFVRILEKTAMS